MRPTREKGLTIVVAREDAGPILNGIPSQLPDIDPEETKEWLDSLDGVIDAGAVSALATSCSSSWSGPAR